MLLRYLHYPSSHCRRTFLPTLGAVLPLVTPTIYRSRDCWKSISFTSLEKPGSLSSHLEKPTEDFFRCQRPCQQGLTAGRSRCPRCPACQWEACRHAARSTLRNMVRYPIVAHLKDCERREGLLYFLASGQLL